MALAGEQWAHSSSPVRRHLRAAAPADLWLLLGDMPQPYSFLACLSQAKSEQADPESWLLIVTAMVGSTAFRSPHAAPHGCAGCAMLLGP